MKTVKSFIVQTHVLTKHWKALEVINNIYQGLDYKIFYNHFHPSLMFLGKA